MPTTFKVANHKANTFTQAHRPKIDTVHDLLNNACPNESRQCLELLRCSFDGEDLADVWPVNNGFVNTVLRAYNEHHHLVIRPDDVWMSILSQLSLYINVHAEELRSKFVDHEGKKELVVYAAGNRYSVDFGKLAVQMTDLLHANLSDKGLRDWIVPKFSTTTTVDTTIYAIQMMATMKAYFEYKTYLMCGLPSVTLLGEKSDWQSLLDRIPKLAEFGDEAAQWADILQPILSRFVDAFDGKPDVDFWSRIAHYDSNGSGPTYLSGWITAFCPWNKEGKWMDSSCKPRSNLLSPSPRSIVVGPKPKPAKGAKGRRALDWITIESIREEGLVLDGRTYPILDLGEVPAGYCSVDVKLDDNGQVFDTMLVAGHFAMRGGGKGRDTLSPAPGWFMFVKGEDPAAKLLEQGGNLSFFQRMRTAGQI